MSESGFQYKPMTAGEIHAEIRRWSEFQGLETSPRLDSTLYAFSEVLSRQQQVLYAYIQSLAAQMMWLYPDGSTSQFEPLDKQIWTELDPIGNVIRKWEWSRQCGQWFDITKAPYINPFTSNATYGYTNDPLKANEPIKPAKCECGSDSVGSPRHSHYCPKYNPKQ